MEMERINEDTIRVEIDNSDLAERGVTFLDLLGNRKQIETFFYSILEEVDVDEQFHESDAITFQVLPKGNGLELYISKDAGIADRMDYSSENGDFDSEELSQYIRDKIADDNSQQDEIDSYLNDPTKATYEEVFEFEQFEDLIGLSKILFLENAISNVYFYKDHYYLEIVFFTEEMQGMNPDREIAMAMEYGKKTSVTSGVLEEHGKRIMEQTALELTRHYFK